MADTEPQITKRKVTMRSVVLNPVTGEPETHEAVDYVPDDVRGGANVLEAYVADARTRWQFVTVGDLDAGEAGYHGETFIPETLDHPLAGRVFSATTPDQEN